MSDDATRREKVHAAAGLLWPALTLGQLALFAHAARGGPETFLPWAEGYVALAPWLLALTGGALLVWLALGAALRFRLGRDESMRRLRRVLAPLSVAFALAHGWITLGRVAIGGADAAALWNGAVDTISHTGPAWAYAFGAAALALQLEQAARVLSEIFGFPRREALVRWYGLAAIVVSGILLLVAYDGLAALIGGRPLIGGAG